MVDRKRSRQMHSLSSCAKLHAHTWRLMALVAWIAILSSSTLPVVTSSPDQRINKPSMMKSSLRSQKYSARLAGYQREMLIGTNPQSIPQVARPPRALSSTSSQKQKTRTLKVTKSSSEDEEASLGISGVGKGKGTKSQKSAKQPTPAPAKASSTKSSKSNGKGKGKGSDNIFDNDDYPSTDDSTDYDDDGIPHYSPTPAPVANPSPTQAPVTSPTSPVSTPTQAPTPSPSNSEPTTGREPTTNPPVQLEPTASPVAECPIGSDGSFGSQVGLTEEVTFVYQAEVIPSVTVSEMNLEILNNVETLLGEIALENLFDQCAATSSSSVSTSSTGTRKHLFRAHRRQLQTTQDLTGFSIRPRDTVIEDVECVNVEQVFPCHVIQGRVTAYSDHAIDDDTIDDVFAALQVAIENGSLESSDSRILGVTWRDLTVDPLPGTDDDNVQDDDTPSDDDSTDDGGINDDDTTAKTSAPTYSPVSNPTNPVIRGEDEDGLELWAYVLIGVGSLLVCCTAYLCLRPPARPPVLDDYDDGEPSDSSDDNFEDEIEPKERIPLVAPPVYEPPPDRNAATARSATMSKSTPPQNRQPQDAYVVGSTATPTPIQEVDESSKSSSKSKSQSSRSRSSRSRSSRSSGSPIERQSTKGSQSSLIRDDTEELKDNNRWTASAAPRGEKMPQDSGHTLELDNKSGQEPSVLSFQMESSGEVELEVEESNSDSKWDENEFAKNAAPPMESTSEEFSSEYSEEEVVEEYEIEYVEEAEASDGEEESGSYSDEFSDEDGEGDITYYDDDNIVRDEPGKSPILPWLAQDDQ
eukprot:Nitzschia sp. Nitz4//scaffold89_size161592//17567//20066//NITZ4_002362-RA/size161592-snap-gene-0.169-mRNA-1//-1//CDS//3329559568//3092//frame0